MSVSQPTAPAVPSTPSVGHRKAAWAAGAIGFASILMVIGGVFQALAGLAALSANQIYLAGPNYVYAFDVTTWGWIHLLIGVFVAVAGFGLVAGRAWARGVAIVLAVLSMIANFLFIPYYPVWSLLIIGLGVIVIWAICSYPRETA